MDRRDVRLGTDARREWIEVEFVGDAADSTLRGKVWAVDSYPLVSDHDQNPLKVVPEGTSRSTYWPQVMALSHKAWSGAAHECSIRGMNPSLRSAAQAR